MSERYIGERLRERLENRDNPRLWQEVLCTYEEEREEAADEIERLCDQLSAVHACAADTEYSQWERIRELERALDDMLQTFGKPIHNESVNGGASYKRACEVLNRARLALSPAEGQADALH